MVKNEEIIDTRTIGRSTIWSTKPCRHNRFRMYCKVPPNGYYY